ncbi:hypothetical protein NDU88_004299 [Pleurodeles waltl]|uniref:Uncharacterized protein n=1 Tax=Pleurodeles waltl TaxID=8319 RepID=A0AAV7M5Y7_PLEWA|nr:hypothetical protein NDU88_004299 [Pleurodeles waltl]
MRTTVPPTPLARGSENSQRRTLEELGLPRTCTLARNEKRDTLHHRDHSPGRVGHREASAERQKSGKSVCHDQSIVGPQKKMAVLWAEDGRSQRAGSRAAVDTGGSERHSTGAHPTPLVQGGGKDCQQRALTEPRSWGCRGPAQQRRRRSAMPSIMMRMAPDLVGSGQMPVQRNNIRSNTEQRAQDHRSYLVLNDTPETSVVGIREALKAVVRDQFIVFAACCNTLWKEKRQQLEAKVKELGERHRGTGASDARRQLRVAHKVLKALDLDVAEHVVLCTKQMYYVGRTKQDDF